MQYSHNDFSYDEEDKKIQRMKFIYNALENGWTVRKTDGKKRTFEFSKSRSVGQGRLKDLMSESGVCFVSCEPRKMVKITSEPILKNKQS